MAKYRITSIPQELPQARYGKIIEDNRKIKKRWFKSPNKSQDLNDKETQTPPMVEVQGVQQPSYWNESLPGYMRGEGCPPGSYMFNGQCLPESEYIAASKAEMNQIQKDFEAKQLARRLALVKDINDIRSKTNEEHTRWVAEDSAKYLDTFAKSKKQDKIEPYIRESESKYSPETLEELKKNFLVHKKDGFVELYPLNLVKDRIITNGFQADQFKNYWGLDPKQVKEQLGDLMGAAKANYEAEVTKTILTKAIEQGKPVDQVIKGLSPKIGTQSGLKSTFEKPTNKIIDDAYASLVSSMDAIPGTDRAKVEQDRKIFLESDDPMDAWERRYHSGTNNLGDFINYQSQKTERGEKAYSDWMDKYGKAGQYDGLTFAKDDAMANVRQNNAFLNQTLNQKNALAAANTAKAKDFNDAYAAYLGNFQSDATKQVLKQALDKAGSNAQGKLEILKSFQEDPNQAMQKLLEQKTGNKKETYADVLNSSVDAMLMRELNPDTIKQGTGINENTTGSKVRDVLANPFDAAYFAMNPREEMWGNSNQSYETRKDIAKKFGVDTGLMPNDNPLAIVRDYTMLQAANPFKIGTNLRKGYDKGEFLSALGDELIDIGTKRGMMKGTNALLSGQGFKQGLQAFNNPLFTAGFMAKTPENISNAYNNFQQGNYGTAALDALEGYWGAAPLIRGIKPAVGTLQTLNSLRTPGTVAFGNVPSRFTGVYNAATPGSGLVLGNPNITGAKPIYESITNPLNKVSKRLGLGEFSILEQNPEGYFGTGSYPLLGYSDGGLIKARTGTIVKGLQALGTSGKTAARIANIGTIGTVNTLAKNIAPVMLNPAKIPMFGASIEKMGPFTGSPLNAFPFYGEKMNPLDGTAFRKFGDTLDYVKMSGELNPAAGPLLRMGKKQIMSEGNWAEPYEPNEQYSGVFGAQFNRNVPGSDLGFEKMSNRNGVLVTDALGNRKPSIPLSEPGLSFHRRLPFSNRYIPVNMDKLRNDQFDWRTQGGNLQSLIERYGYGAAYAAALAGMGMAAPQEYLDEYVTEPIKKVYGKAEELLTNPWVKPKNEKGGLVKARTGLPVVAESLSSAIKPSSKIITPIVNTLPGFTERRNIIQGLKELGYVGPQTMGADMLKAAKSDESLKKFMQSAIDYDRTGFRQVSGQFHPIGNRLDNYGNHGQYNMYEVSGENPLSEYENMITRGVDMDNPLSLGAYQATSIPMDQYGYRAGLPDMSRMDGLYLAPTPNTQQYGRYQFKVKQDMDLDSGNWQDLFDQYIIGKNRIYNQDGRVRHNLDPNKVYFADPGRKGIEGSGIDMRIWTGGKGKQVGIIDPTFKFTDLKNMSAEDYLDMDTYKKSLLNRWNTGFRGDYKKGGMVAKLSKKEIDQYIKDGYIIEDE